MNISEATKITVLHHTVKFKSSVNTVATLWLENENAGDVYISIDNSELRDNFIKSGIGYDRWKDVISKELFTKVTIDRFKMLNDFYSSLSSIRDNIPSNIKDGVVLVSDELKEFMGTDSGKLLQQLLDKNYPDGLTDEERRDRHQEILRPYFQPSQWEVTRGRFGDVFKHQSGLIVTADDERGGGYKLDVRMPEQDYDNVFKEMSEHDFIEEISSLFAKVLSISTSDIQVGSISKVNELEVSEGEEASLRFPITPYLVTNTSGNYNVDNIKLKRIGDVLSFRALDLSERACMGVLIDFNNPKLALEMLDIANGQDVSIYYIQPAGGTVEIMPIEEQTHTKRNTRRSRRGII